jgi:glycosyltransferase involved in cell wall biosynthesis
MKSIKPLVSVCIPVYNGQRFIAGTIESVLRQTLTDYELILVDDHSSDRSLDIMSAYNDDRLRIVTNDRTLGPERNWNRCLKESKGRYFKLLPQDDVLSPTCLERQASVLDEDREKRTALVFCARAIIDAGGRTWMSRRYPSCRKGAVDGRRLIRRCLRFGTNLIGEPGSCLFRKELVSKAGFFDAGIPYVIDLDYWFRLLLLGDGYYLPERLASFRVSEGSWSVAIGKGQGAQFRGFVKKISRNPDYQAGASDILAAKLMSRLNGVIRALIYHFILRHG